MKSPTAILRDLLERMEAPVDPEVPPPEREIDPQRETLVGRVENPELRRVYQVRLWALDEVGATQKALTQGDARDPRYAELVAAHTTAGTAWRIMDLLFFNALADEIHVHDTETSMGLRTGWQVVLVPPPGTVVVEQEDSPPPGNFGPN